MATNGKARHGGWRQRLSQAVYFPSRDEVYRFMDSTVRPAMEEMVEVSREKGLVVETQFDSTNANLQLTIGHGEEHPFIYQVIMQGYFTPSFARAGIGGLHLKNRRYYRAEVHLTEGSQDYDLVGYNREQILNEVWGYEEFPTTRTIDNFVAKLRQKIERAPHAPEHILTIHGSGYKFVG